MHAEDELPLYDDDFNGVADDGEERDSRGRTREDHEADEADRKLKMLKEDGSYKRWRKSGLSYAEFQRRELEDEFERARRRHGGS